jgi:cytochrome c5
MMNPSRILLIATSTFLLTAALAVGAQNSQSQSQSQDAQTQSAPDDGHSNFPPGEGRELTIKVCSTCHPADVLAEQQMDLDGWKETVSQMASMGADATEPQLDQIVKYLAKAFPDKETK